MTDQWDRVGVLFDAALACPPADRSHFIEQSREAPEVKAEVLSLLAAHDSAGDFLEQPATDTPTLAEGTLVGGYRIKRVLGTGGMGVVYEADDVRLHRRVALKSLSPQLASDERQRRRLEQEARAAAALAHPGIATVYALEETGGQLYIVSEYLDGHTLRTEIENGTTTIESAVATALEIARALCAAHERGVVHRDLKPENIVRTSDGAVKILDFGLAQFDDAARDLTMLSRLTQSGFLVGTPPYMSPEQLLGRGTDFHTDHFSFGVLFYELCTGTHPFGGESLPSTIARILAAEPRLPRPLDTMPPEVWTIIERCLQKEPAARYAATRDLVGALAAIAPASAVTSTAASTSTSTTHPGTSHPAPRTSHREALWWWRFHQFAAAIVYWVMAVPVWNVHRLLGSAGLFFFLATLAAIVVAANLRLHLAFSSYVYPQDLEAQRSDVGRWIRGADVAFAALLIIGGIALPESARGWAALFISFGIGAMLAALIIEPATARAAFRGR